MREHRFRSLGFGRDRVGVGWDGWNGIGWDGISHVGTSQILDLIPLDTCP